MLTQWRVAYARQQVGEEGIILASIQKNNAGSLATAQKWSQGFIGLLNNSLNRIHAKPPMPMPGITVRLAQPADFGPIAQGLNTFYQEYNLYTPETAGTMVAWLNQTPFAVPFRHYYVAVDKSDHILAGAAVTEQCRVTTMNIHVFL